MGKLVICPTPLGNLGDITKRCLQALEACDVVCCEDTRVTGKLLSALGIEKRLERLDEETISHQASRIVDRIAKGETIAYCSDAGMPGVSDPGQRLIAAVYEAGQNVEVLPGVPDSDRRGNGGCNRLRCERFYRSKLLFRRILSA